MCHQYSGSDVTYVVTAPQLLNGRVLIRGPRNVMAWPASVDLITWCCPDSIQLPSGA